MCTAAAVLNRYPSQLGSCCCRWLQLHSGQQAWLLSAGSVVAHLHGRHVHHQPPHPAVCHPAAPAGHPSLTPALPVSLIVFMAHFCCSSRRTHAICLCFRNTTYPCIHSCQVTPLKASSPVAFPHCPRYLPWSSASADAWLSKQFKSNGTLGFAAILLVAFSR